MKTENSHNAISQHYFYDVNGWRIDSEISFTELWPSEQTNELPDITIRFGKVPKKLEGCVARGVGFQVKPDHYILDIEGVGRFMATYGKFVCIEPCLGVEEKELRVYVLGSVFGAIAHQRCLLPMHASAVQYGKGAILFAGHSGAGKSTTAASFMIKDYRVITDDLAVVYFDSDNQPILHPGTARLKLLASVVSQMSISQNLSSVGTHVQKYVVPLEQSGKPETTVVTHLFLLKESNEKEVSIRELQGREKYYGAFNNVFRFRLMKGLGVPNNNFVQLSKFIEGIRIYEVLRPIRANDKLGLASYIEAVLESED
jgi:hypothetical protein